MLSKRSLELKLIMLMDKVSEYIKVIKLKYMDVR